jgi:hypothetical protein
MTYPLYPRHGEEYTQAMEKAIAEYKAWEAESSAVYQKGIYVYRRKEVTP